MAHFLGHGGVFDIYVDGALVPTVTLTDEEVTQIIMLHLAQAKLIMRLSEQVSHTAPTGRRLLNQHKPLKTLPHSPHH
jgi:hypothetical protein